MLAHKLNIALAALSVALFAFAVTGTAQQPQQPSQRYEPVRIQPPSVHVPPKQMRQLTQQQHYPSGAASSSTQANPAFSHSAPVHRLSDSPAPSRQSTNRFPPRPPYERGVIQRTSFSSPIDDQPDVPAILAGSAATPQQSHQAAGSTANRRASDSVAGAIQAVNDQLAGQQKVVNQKLKQLRQQNESDAANRLTSTSKPQTIVLKSSDQSQTGFSESAAGQSTSRSAHLNNGQIANQQMDAQTSGQSAPHQDEFTTPKLVASPSAAETHVAQRTEFVSNTAEIENTIRRTSGTAESESAAVVDLQGPAIQIETFGPRTIGINKTATYKILVRNNSKLSAEGVLIGVNMPQWIEFQNINLSNGTKEITDGVDQARLVWTVDHIPANSTQTMTLITIPRKAEMFDIGVEWTLMPRNGSVNIDVTEPRLEMKIAGPRDVLYGEKAIYHVTVRNPGTGAAENVVVMLPEALGGERATLGDIKAGQEKNFQVELLARTAGQLDLTATAAGDGNLKASADKQIAVRRADLNIAVDGPPMKYAGSIGEYSIVVTNTGDAAAHDVIAAVALPMGVKYVGGVDAVNEIENGLRWTVGTLEPGDQRAYKINCELNASGDLQLEVGARGDGELAASSACMTSVETVADLVLSVEDPKGPLPTGQDVMYEIHVRNRGSRAATEVNLVMQFSEGIEPTSAQGLKNRIVPGQVLFSPINRIDPNQELVFKISAQALTAGTHVFRAQLTCADSDSREIAEGTTRFFGEDVQSTPNTASAESEWQDSAESEDSNEFKR